MKLYGFSFKYDDEPNSLIRLPLAPETFKTTIGNKNKTIELISIGEANIIKSIGLRSFSFKVYLPKDYILSDLRLEDFKEPIFYLNKFREYKENAKPIRFIITRILQDGKFIFDGNLLVSFESYTVTEKWGEEGSFWVDIKLKEYKSIVSEIKEKNKDENENKSEDDDTSDTIELEKEVQRTTKDTPKEYTVVDGDNLWKIAKLLLNDGSRYKEIAELNGINDVNNIPVSMVLKLPES